MTTLYEMNSRFWCSGPFVKLQQSLTLSRPNKLSSAIFLVCFNFQSSLMLLKVVEYVAWVSNKWLGVSSRSKLIAYGTLVVLGGLRVKICQLTLSPPTTTKVPYANCLTLRQHFHQFWVTLKHFENWSRQEIYQTTYLFCGLRVKRDMCRQTV